MILAIESSCDDSALALFSAEKGFLGEWVYRQTALHQAYGGVVPDLAAREHTIWLPALLKEALSIMQGVSPSLIAVTQGPGLPGSLAVGVSFAQALSLEWQVPVFPVNHLQGHAFSPFIPLFERHLASGSFPEDLSLASNIFKGILSPYLPHLGLLVSGSNTALFELAADLSFKILAQTVDDAAGEALDKGAKLLGMPYPGGPLIEKHALGGSSKAFDFPRAFPEKDVFKFSFSGLKTSLRYRLEAMDDAAVSSSLSDLCASYQGAVVDALVKKTSHLLAHKRHWFKSLGLSGGVAQNKLLREKLTALAGKEGLPLFLADGRHTGDNAGMIAFCAFLQQKEREPLIVSSPLPFLASLTLQG